MANFEPKICPECGREFKPNAWNQKYCKECKGVAELRRHREWYKKNRAKKPGGGNKRSAWHKDWESTSMLANKKPKGCGFKGSCFECPYPDCIGY